MLKIAVIKRPFLVMSAALLAAASVIFIASSVGAKVRASKESALFTVVIDAGHGGIDGGVTGVNTGVPESELNLAVAKLLRDNFKNAGFRVVMTRTSASGLYGAANSSLKKTDMQNRRKIIEEAAPDVVISIHMNKYSLPSRRGAQVFYRSDEQSHIFADCVQAELNGAEDAVRECSALIGDYFILNVSPCPAVLVECGFLSNPEDEALLVTEEYRKKLAYTIFKGTVVYLSGMNEY